MGFPMVPRATRPSPVFFLPQWSADFRVVTGASLLVIPRGGTDHSRSPRMAQTRHPLHRWGMEPTLFGGDQVDTVILPFYTRAVC
jgi:hypothetical protein